MITASQNKSFLVLGTFPEEYANYLNTGQQSDYCHKLAERIYYRVSEKSTKLMKEEDGSRNWKRYIYSDCYADAVISYAVECWNSHLEVDDLIFH